MKYKKLLGCLTAVTMALSGVMEVSAATMKDLFDAEYYVSAYPDLKENYGENAETLWNHFITQGIAEGRNMNPFLDVVKYRAMYTDLSVIFGDDWDAYVNHYLNVGAVEGRNSGTDFDFLEMYGDRQNASGEDILALLTHKTVRGTKRLEGYYSGYSILEHDSDGRLVKVTGYSEHGIKNSEYIYDAEGKLISRSFYRSTNIYRPDGDGACYFREENVPDDRWDVKYDNDGNYRVTYALCYNEMNDFVAVEGNWAIWECDSDGNHYISNFYSSFDGGNRFTKHGYNGFGDHIYYGENQNFEGDLNERYYEVDHAGNCVKEIYYCNGGKVSGIEREFEYDSLRNRDRVRKVIHYGDDGSISSWTEYKYNDAGNGKMIKSYNADGSVADWTEWEEWEVGDGYNICTSYKADGSLSSRTIYTEDYEGTFSSFYYDINDGIKHLNAYKYTYYDIISGTIYDGWFWENNDGAPYSAIPWEERFSEGLSTRHIKFNPK